MNEQITVFSLDKKESIKKGWGEEILIAPNSSEGFCGKLLVYDKPNSLSSNHLHKYKSEVFWVLSGTYRLKITDTFNGKTESVDIIPGSVITIPPMCPHQIFCLTPGTIVEFSSSDSVNDNFRIEPGDSQK